MELRSCSSNLHFIQVIRGGSVVKVRNVDSRGRPALVFKKLKDIYEIEDAKNPGSLSTIKPKVKFECLPLEHDSDNTPSTPVGEGKTIESDPETYEFNGNGGDDKRVGDLDDLSFGEITLKQLMERCKTKKRKLTKSVELNKQNIETSSPLKQDYSDWQLKQDEFDLKEPLSSLKSKLRKKRYMKRCAIKSSQSAVSVKSEEISSKQDLLQSGLELFAPVSIKVEVSDPDSLHCKVVVHDAHDFSLSCNEQVGSNALVSGEIPKDAEICVLDTGESISFTEETISCAVNTVSHEHLELAKNSLTDVATTGGSITRSDGSETRSHASSVLQAPELQKQECFTHPLLHEIFPREISPPMDYNSALYDSFGSHSFPHKMSWQINICTGVQCPDMAINNSLQCTKRSAEGDAALLEDDRKNDFSHIEDVAISSPMDDSSSCCNSNACLSPDSFLVPVDGASPTTKGKQSLMSVNAERARNCAAKIHSCDDSNELSTLEATGSYHHSDLHHPPERLLSTRKVISPTSQERLCKAMKAVELHDDAEHYKCRGSLCFARGAENETLSAGLDNESTEVTINAEGPEQINGGEVSINCKRIIRKPKNDSNGLHPDGDSHLSRAPPRVSSGCSSIQSCSESAILFSQRQMHDIESLATKLTKELKSLKDIVEETLHSNTCVATSSKYNPDEVRLAIENARKAEKTARRWLSMMARDCNRFCKIMRMKEEGSVGPENTVEKGSAGPESPENTVEEGSVGPENSVHKERKKIIFADEAGGELCHVKIFKDDMASIGVQ